MMQSMRKQAKGFLAFILFGLLILSFGVWGIGDIFRPVSGRDVVIEIGGTEIPAEQLARDVQREIQALRARSGVSLDYGQALRFGLVGQTISRLVGSTLLDLATRDMGVAVSDRMISDAVRNDPNFRNQFGKFDRQRYRQTLASLGMSERMYEETLRGGLARRQLAGGVAASESVPKSLAHAIYRHRRERRVADILFIPNASLTGLGAPDQAALETFHKDNEARFMAPEFREVTAVIIRPDDLAANIDVSDERLQEEYRNRLDEFETSERRAVEQLLFSGESEAKAAYDRIRSGEDFAAVGADVLPLGTVAKGELPLAALGDGAFALDPGTASAPIKTALGWHIVRVTKIEPGSTTSFADAREKLKTLVKRELAVDAAIDLGEELDKEIGGGTSVVDAARQFGLALTRIPAMDAKGQDAEGKPIAAIPQGSDFVQQAFLAIAGEDGLLSDADDGSYFILRVDGITPAAVRPLDSIRDKVAAAWTAERKAEEARKTAQSVTERIAAGVKLAELAGEVGQKVRTTDPFTRDGDGAGDHVSAALVEKMFALRVGDAAWAPTLDGTVVGVAKEVKSANPLSDSKGVKAVSDRLRQVMAVDFLAQYTNALRDRYPVEIDQAAVEDMFTRQ